VTLLTSVVVNYRTPRDLSRFLHSYTENPPRGQSSLIVVNNDPQEADLEAVEPFDQIVDMHLSQGNLYYSGALNRAAKWCNSEVMAFFNADTQIRAGVLDHCSDLLMSDPLFAVVGPGQVSSRGLTTHAGIFGTLDRPRHRGWKERWKSDFEDTREAVTVSGSAYFVKTDVYHELWDCPQYREIYPDVEGAFLPTTHYYEETWFSYHAQAHGYKVMYTGEMQMVHEWHGASPVGGWAEQQMPKSRRMFREMCQHHSIQHD
jgi:GT2 family glycosyltransferase